MRSIFHALNLGWLRAAAMLVPRPERAEWMKEWRAELWHVRQTRVPGDTFSWSGEHSVASFCLGAFQDALCLRRGFAAKKAQPARMHGSALQCLLGLMAVATICGGCAFLLPRVHSQMRPSQHLFPRGLVLIPRAVSFHHFEDWRQQRHLFAASAFYRIDREPVSRDLQGANSWTVGHSSSNLLQLLAIQVRFPSSAGSASGKPHLILSDELWRAKFGASRKVIGTVIQVSQREAVVAGVAAPDAWGLPGRIDAWLIEPDAELAGPGNGFVIAQLSPKAEREWYGTGHHTFARDPEGSTEDLLYEPLAERNQGPWGTFLFAIFLAALALPATTPLSLGEYRPPSIKHSWVSMLRRWSFLACKLALLAAITYFLSLDLAYMHPAQNWRSPACVQLFTAFCVCLLGLRWVLRDQRKRCPVCLRKLTHPARVGQPSRNFLAWNGTELMCAGGHGLLHVPELSTSWFSTQRWLHLDRSWDVLFAEPVIASSKPL